MKKRYISLGAGLLLALSMACSDDMRTEDRFLNPAPDADGNKQETNPYWSWVGTFPGWIDLNLERVGNTPVEINGVYRKVDPASRIDFQQTPWISTGFYAAPGEMITLVKPSRLNTAVSWRIGEWKCELDGVADLKRFGKVYETGRFDQDTVHVRSWFGGHIYILPDEPFVRPEVFIVRNAVISPDFIAGKTDPAAWKEAIKNTKIPYAELIGKRTIWTLPVATLQKITDPEGLLALYDDIIGNDFNSFHGFSDAAVGTDQAPTFPLRIVQDLQTCGNLASHSGYPIVIDQSVANLGVDVDGMRSSSVAWNFYKEVGNDYKVWPWCWTTVKDVCAMLPYYHSRARILNSWPSVTSEKDEPDKGVVKWDYVIRDYVLKSDPSKNFEMAATVGGNIGKAINNNNARMIPFIQLAQQYGWKLYAYLGKCSRELEKNDAAVLKHMGLEARRDFFCKHVSEYANANLIPFFTAWGIGVSPVALKDLEKLPEYTGEKFWEKWESGKMPSLAAEQHPSIKLPDDNYNNVAAKFDQTQWSVDSTSGTAMEGKPENVINGKYGVDDKTNYHWVSEKVARPAYSPQPWLAFDMKQIYNVEQAYVVQRNFSSNARMHPRLIKLELKEKATDEWVEFYQLPTELLPGQLQMIPIGKAMAARYVRITMMEGFTASSDDNGGVALDEFSLGGTIYVGDGGDIGNGGNDSDFPEWK